MGEVAMIDGGLTVSYETTAEQIAELGASFKGVTFDTPENYETGRKAIAQVRTLRTAVERRRKELKADSLAFGRRVDDAAKHLTGLLEAIENPMLEAKRAVDEAVAKAKRDAERAELLAIEERTRHENEEAQAKLAKEREKLAAEAALQAAKQREIDAAQRLERERLAEQQRKIDARAAELRAREEAAAKVERERVAAEQAKERERREAEDAAALVARAEALKPDIDKLHDFAARVRDLAGEVPVFDCTELVEPVQWARGRLLKTADTLDAFRLREVSHRREALT